MTYLRALSFAGGIALFLSLISCSDPSGVGLGVGEDTLDGGEPELVTVRPESLAVPSSPPVTGFDIVETGATQSWRFLTGGVTDYGRVEADGYVDFAGRSFIPDTILNASSDSLKAELRLQTEYVHGDTSANLSIALSGLSEEADMQDARADTTFRVRQQVDTYERSPTDSLVVLPLPQSWLDDNLDILRDTTNEGGTFETSFHGFRLSASDADAVIGFDHDAATVRLSKINDGPSVDFSVRKSFTHLEQTATPTIPPNRRLMQAGIGQDLVIKWNAATLDSVRGNPLARGRILIPTDTGTGTAADPSFVRPSANDFRLRGTRGANAPPCGAVNTAPFTSAGKNCLIPLIPNTPGGVLEVIDNVARPILEETLRPGSGSVFSLYRAEVTDREGTDTRPANTVSLGLPSTIPVLIPTTDATDIDQPRIEVIVTPL